MSAAGFTFCVINLNKKREEIDTKFSMNACRKHSAYALFVKRESFASCGLAFNSSGVTGVSQQHHLPARRRRIEKAQQWHCISRGGSHYAGRLCALLQHGQSISWLQTNSLDFVWQLTGGLRGFSEDVSPARDSVLQLCSCHSHALITRNCPSQAPHDWYLEQA